jgi:hypothetical protein
LDIEVAQHRESEVHEQFCVLRGEEEEEEEEQGDDGRATVYLSGCEVASAGELGDGGSCGSRLR